VYCSTRKKTETVARDLKAAGFAAGHYHAGRTGLARDRAQAAFALGRTRVLVATCAFGMGIDYPDIRVIVHFQAPGSLEAYYQEAGRAGRDGEPGRCVMLFGASDLVTQRRLHDGASGGHHADALVALERYARATTCRQQRLCTHFTGTDDEATCGRCDACTDPDAVASAQWRAPDQPGATAAARRAATLGTPRAHDDVPVLGAAARQVILDAVGAVHRRVGRVNLARALRGSHAKAVVTQGLERLPQFGALAELDEDAIIAAIDQLIGERRLVRRGRKYPTVALPGPPRQARPRPARERFPSAASRDAQPVRSSGRTRPRASSVMLALDTYRRRMARQLKWKTYMVFQRGVIAAIDQQRPTSKEDLARIPGLGPAKIARFGDDILALLQREAPRELRQ
jgi:ATP-dependent DNA helicase RecQ